ncbi:MAG TPA: hypothetical protein PLJ47_01605 [Candidatus Hydrogenedentes bacterium]|nr:hypothetical protein [Candidatus Hydrogenedentota bacterium]
MYAQALFCVLSALAADGPPLDGTAPLTIQGDFPMQMVAGIDAYLDRALDESVAKRAAHWSRDFSSPEAYDASVEPNRERLRKIIGTIDKREPVELTTIGYPGAAGLVETSYYSVNHARWTVFRGVEGEGLILEPKMAVKAQIVILPDAGEAPELLADVIDGSPRNMPIALYFAEIGCRVIVPVLIDRNDTWSGVDGLCMTNQPHREYIYRTGYELGRHIIGYEVQKTLAVVDWFSQRDPDVPIGVAGRGEGGLIALYASALDPRIDVTVVSGYFKPREEVWKEPIYRNVWSLLHEFGDAEIASLVAPRSLIIEAADHPAVTGPPAPRDGRDGAAPGVIETPPAGLVAQEVERAKKLVAGLSASDSIALVNAPSNALPNHSWRQETVAAFQDALKIVPIFGSNPGGGPIPKFDTSPRMKRQVQQLVDDTQYLMHQAEFRRKEFWAKADATSPESWAKSVEPYREYLNEEAIGALPAISLPPNARTRLVYDQPTYRGYEVVLDVYADVFAYGILLIPKDIAPGEKRPVVVCQHGLEGRVQEVADPAVDSHYYHQFACKLAERGFITYAPQNPYIGEDKFRVLQRKANPLKVSLFSFIVRQHEQTLNWLGSLPFVDSKRIAFYGLSYGGKTALRVPALLDGYCLSICSGDYNEWIWKCASVSHSLSYVFTGEDEMWEWNLGNTFNHAEMSWLIYPRPFMVERGHHDGVGYDEWVAYEFARTKRHYVLLGSGDDAEIEYFNGPHTIHGVGTFAFLHEKLDFPPRVTPRDTVAPAQN